ncbi:hypothetical protein HanRHA438_Chr14g0640461 [Helianthus annuus]|nr:hypothetical protein HanHA89_Chr14g0559531 [Helianthus annuus]KAJ0655229.1 hypothetical protein HanLR1_Chr14g0521821 [Helianthus annuus]KAJ0658930.1 hypothetical protein HanOQP8_Chr14g0520231 [Helianthus annuus]KAJ0839177.1 hypothetical protein HanPSC8_Chr14g0603791 [Helianthus annuus]KAJ0852499.1 hypothetical protein HanRHA438_Chr14g0640461 [Helianthus annuus]
MKLNFRGEEDILAKTLKTPVTEIWNQDIKDIPSIELPERALVATKMSLHWKADRHDKPVYVEVDKFVALYVVAFKRENGKMSTIQKGADEETWYHRIVKNFALPKDADLNAQPSAVVGTFLLHFLNNIAILLFAGVARWVIFQYIFLWIGELINLGVGPDSKKKKTRTCCLDCTQQG